MKRRSVFSSAQSACNDDDMFSVNIDGKGHLRGGFFLHFRCDDRLSSCSSLRNLRAFVFNKSPSIACSHFFCQPSDDPLRVVVDALMLASSACSRRAQALLDAAGTLSWSSVSRRSQRGERACPLTPTGCTVKCDLDDKYTTINS